MDGCEREGAYGSGLSVSHDSVFTGERSGDESGDERPGALGIAQVAASHRAELVAAVRRRGRGECSDDEEDLGLPRSPPASPPTDKADKVKDMSECQVSEEDVMDRAKWKRHIGKADPTILWDAS
ncbi:hypothetical protein RR46_03161 [Papilio xuthus]|uniref:Uncharacterized protein n=1 Tax=Papilio xuthus TaxID=66420 RepID=A0A194Q7M3_PAPXU|nr:hypothetical protein RR46_03161 [Papilio xuthus]